LIQAVKKSCNVYFYQVGLRLGDTLINRYATMLGLGQKTGVDIPIERSGWLSGEDAYNKRFKSRGWTWTRGLLLDLAIGQTQLVTPIQLACMIGALGNGRHLWRPFLAKEIRDVNGIVIEQTNPAIRYTLPFDSTTIAGIHEAMIEVMRPGGTGGRAAVRGVVVGGKTGSAENPHGEKTHALFVACAPVGDPMIAIGVVVENAGHGGSVAAPIAGVVLRKFFEECVDPEQLDAVTQGQR
jgi:penicillin-binding protein 2